jgi:predicted esterase
MLTQTIATTTHGRYAVDRPAGDGPFPLLVGFHGYKESAEHMLAELVRIRGERPWLLVSVQALNRFYDRDNSKVIAGWMTRQDRELAIADNIAYVASVVAAVRRDHPTRDPLVYAGFSQGVAMAYRAAAFAAPAAGVIVLAGDVPPDVAPLAAALPPVLIGRGTTDHWYTEAKAAADLAVLRAAGTPVSEHIFEGGHVWGPSFLTEAGALLDSLLRNPKDGPQKHGNTES